MEDLSNQIRRIIVRHQGTEKYWKYNSLVPLLEEAVYNEGLNLSNVEDVQLFIEIQKKKERYGY